MANQKLQYRAFAYFNFLTIYVAILGIVSLYLLLFKDRDSITWIVNGAFFIIGLATGLFYMIGRKKWEFSRQLRQEPAFQRFSSVVHDPSREDFNCARFLELEALLKDAKEKVGFERQAARLLVKEWAQKNKKVLSKDERTWILQELPFINI